jgi:cysteine desulfurase/selenocysteine lyase
MAVMSTTALPFGGFPEGLGGLPDGLPDENFLQELANQFFSAPLVSQEFVPPAPQDGAALSVPGSVAGSGISPSAVKPSAVNQGNSVDLADPQTSLPDPHFAGTGHVPGSVAGSGISPSYIFL